jgi:transketolase
LQLLEKLPAAALRDKADAIRREVIEVAVANGAGHIAPSLSTVDILTALYYGVLELADDPGWAGRDRLVFSKAHGCYALYAILADRGYLAREAWRDFYRSSPLAGCAERDVGAGLEASCGSLGHGLPMATGIAFGAKLQGLGFRTYCVVGDGELQEGSNWEAVQFAVKHELANLVIIVDGNRLQAMDFLEQILTPAGRADDLLAKLGAFGCQCATADGHDAAALAAILAAWRTTPGSQPRALYARTVKGYGLRCMEDVPRFHFRVPTADELALRGPREGGSR